MTEQKILMIGVQPADEPTAALDDSLVAGMHAAHYWRIDPPKTDKQRPDQEFIAREFGWFESRKIAKAEVEAAYKLSNDMKSAFQTTGHWVRLEGNTIKIKQGRLCANNEDAGRLARAVGLLASPSVEFAKEHPESGPPDFVLANLRTAAYLAEGDLYVVSWESRLPHLVRYFVPIVFSNPNRIQINVPTP